MKKPWEKDHPKAERLRPLINLWHAFLTGDAIPEIAALPKPAKPNPGKPNPDISGPK